MQVCRYVVHIFSQSTLPFLRGMGGATRCGPSAYPPELAMLCPHSVSFAHCHKRRTYSRHAGSSAKSCHAGRFPGARQSARVARNQAVSESVRATRARAPPSLTLLSLTLPTPRSCWAPLGRALGTAMLFLYPFGGDVGNYDPYSQHHSPQ